MKNGLAIWHYPHRTVTENAEYFADCGFESISVHGVHMYNVLSDEKEAEKLAEIISAKNLILTVHHALPVDHSDEKVSLFRNQIEAYGKWQKKFGILSVLSFDVPQDIRDNITPYVDFVLETVEKSKIAVEDFGLNEAERKQIEYLKNNDRFGYLIDIGHLYLRICGKNDSGYTLFTNSPEECPVNENPVSADFLRALRTKEFPIFEMHLHNNDGVEDVHYFLEEGTLKIDEIAKALKDFGFEGILTIESAPGYRFECKYPESDIKINKTFAYWKNMMAES